MESLLSSGAVLEILSFLIIIVLFVWRVPSKGDIQKIDDKIDSLRDDMNSKFQRVDKRFESQRAEFKADIQRLDNKLADFRKDVTTEFQRVEERFAQQDAKSDRLRLELKSDIQRVEDRSAEANEFHAKSVALLDGILRQLQERREPL